MSETSWVCRVSLLACAVLLLAVASCSTRRAGEGTVREEPAAVWLANPGDGRVFLDVHATKELESHTWVTTVRGNTSQYGVAVPLEIRLVPYEYLDGTNPNAPSSAPYRARTRWVLPIAGPMEFLRQD